MAAAIEFENVSKEYPFHAEDSVRDVFSYWGRRLTGREAPGRRIIRALHNVSFKVEEGQSYGIVGINGAGKTTAMKICTRVIYPSAGQVRVRGRVGALIEVGTGMHPELNGHENIDLFGRILGLSRQEVASHKEAIIDFAGIGEAIDQPIKQYSSGMQVRLGFSIASHLDPEVLVVDEAIAVGDVGFKYKCLERMGKMVREGRTLVFVSHEMSALQSLCQRAILLSHGEIDMEGTALEVVRTYLTRIQRQLAAEDTSGTQARGRGLEITNVTLLDRAGNELTDAFTNQPLVARIHYNARQAVQKPFFSLGITEGAAAPLFIATMLVDGHAPDQIQGEGWVECEFENLPLNPRPYEIWGGVRDESGYVDIVRWQRLRRFEVIDPTAPPSTKAGIQVGAAAPVIVPFRWGGPAYGTSAPAAISASRVASR